MKKIRDLFNERNGLSPIVSQFQGQNRWAQENLELIFIIFYGLLPIMTSSFLCFVPHTNRYVFDALPSHAYFSIEALLQQKSDKLAGPKWLFLKQGLKCRWGGSQPKFLVCRSFFIKSFSKKFSGLPQKSDLFQQDMVSKFFNAAQMAMNELEN